MDTMVLLVGIAGLAVGLVPGWALGHHMGYYFGRTVEFFECAKRWGKLPEDVTFEQFLNAR